MNRGKRVCNNTNTGIDAKMEIDGGDCNDVLYTTPDFGCTEFSTMIEPDSAGFQSEWQRIEKQGQPPVFKPSKIEKGSFLHVYDPAQIALIVRAVNLVHSHEAVAKAADNYHRSHCGLSKDCGHDFCCICPQNKLNEAFLNLSKIKKELGYK